MPIIATMELPHESDQPVSAGDGDIPETDRATSGPDPSTGSGPEGLTSERLKNVIRKVETGFYDTPEVREHIAHRVREEFGL
jgi:hypothetical protein